MSQTFYILIMKMAIVAKETNYHQTLDFNSVTTL